MAETVSGGAAAAGRAAADNCRCCCGARRRLPDSSTTLLLWVQAGRSRRPPLAGAWFLSIPTIAIEDCRHLEPVKHLVRGESVPGFQAQRNSLRVDGGGAKHGPGPIAASLERGTRHRTVGLAIDALCHRQMRRCTSQKQCGSGDRSANFAVVIRYMLILHQLIVGATVGGERDTSCALHEGNTHDRRIGSVLCSPGRFRILAVTVIYDCGFPHTGVAATSQNVKRIPAVKLM
jgi:hypothetical protein